MKSDYTLTSLAMQVSGDENITLQTYSDKISATSSKKVIGELDRLYQISTECSIDDILREINSVLQTFVSANDNVGSEHEKSSCLQRITHPLPIEMFLRSILICFAEFFQHIQDSEPDSVVIEQLVSRFANQLKLLIYVVEFPLEN
jgi:hypothetical protein